MAEAEVLRVSVAVCGDDPENVSCAGLKVAVPAGVPKDLSVTVPPKPLLGVIVRLYTRDPPGLMVCDPEGDTASE